MDPRPLGGPAADPADRQRPPRVAWPWPTGLYYSLWLAGTSTLGQFKTYLWIRVLDGGTRGASVLLLVGVPLGVIGALVFARIVDSDRRDRWVAVGSAVTIVGWATFLASPTRLGLVSVVTLSALGATLAGEALYKVTSQELVPTLARASVQGLTMAVARTVAAAVVALTPLALDQGPRFYASIALGTQVLAALVALVYLPHLRAQLLLSTRRRQ